MNKFNLLLIYVFLKLIEFLLYNIDQETKEIMSESIKVVVRIRPMNSKQTGLGCKSIVLADQDNNQISITKPQQPENTKTFAYDSVFADNSLQSNVYAKTAYSLVENVLQGYNGTIFAYGQTGCGKTHSMVGKLDVQELQGIIPRSFGHILNSISETKHRQFLIRCSFIQIYNEQVRDLLGKDVKKGLQIKQSPDKGVFIKDLSSNPAKTHQQLMDYMNLGNKNRSVGQTAMNKDSSRSHLLFMLYLQSADLSVGEQDRKYIGSKLNLVDLAGSQRINKTGAQGQRLQQAKNINLSLSALGNVISALVDGKSHHIPYRDSKLTRLLQDSLGGNTKTVMVANCSPADYNFDQTLSTLRYASRAKFIKNKPIINQDPKDALLKQYANQIKKLKQILSKSGKLPNQLQNTQPQQENNYSYKIKQKQQQLADQKQQKRQLQQRLKALQKQHLISQNVKIDTKIREKIRQVRQSALNIVPICNASPKNSNLKDIKIENNSTNWPISPTSQQFFKNGSSSMQSYKKIVKNYKSSIKSLQNQIKDIQHENYLDKELILNDIRQLSRQNKLLQGIVNILLSPKQLQKIKAKIQLIDIEKKSGKQKLQILNKQSQCNPNSYNFLKIQRTQAQPQVSIQTQANQYGYNEDKQQYKIPYFSLKIKDIILPKLGAIGKAEEWAVGMELKNNSSLNLNNISNNKKINDNLNVCEDGNASSVKISQHNDISPMNKQNVNKYQLNICKANNSNQRKPSKISIPINSPSCNSIQNSKKNQSSIGADVRNLIQQAKEIHKNAENQSNNFTTPQKKKNIAVHLEPIKRQQLHSLGGTSIEIKAKALEKPKKLDKLVNYPQAKLSIFGPVDQ